VVSREGTTEVTFYATDNASNREADQVAQVTIDQGAPVSAAALSPVPNPAGWNQTDVLITITASDSGGTGVREIHYRLGDGAETVVEGDRVSLPISEDGITNIAFFAVDGAGNREGEKSQQVKIDRQPPQSAGTASPAPNTAGWNRTDVVVTLDATDDRSGVKEEGCLLSGAETGSRRGAGEHLSFTIANEGITSVAFGAVDVADNVEATRTLDVRIDKEPPRIVFVGNAGTYTPDQEIDIRVQVTDPLSGVASTDAHDVRGPAYSFPLGPNVIKVTATDRAGNVATESTTFTVRFTFDATRALIQRFVADGGQQTALLRVVDNIESATTAGNAAVRRHQIDALIGTIDNRRGGALDGDQAALLMRLLRSL
jgi:hypothetical protein